jgi:hypothetical protein
MLKPRAEGQLANNRVLVEVNPVPPPLGGAQIPNQQCVLSSSGVHSPLAPQPIASLTPREPSLPRSLGAHNCRITQSVGAYRGNSCCSIFHLGGPDNYMLDARIFDSQPFDLPPHPPISAVARILG